MSEKPLREVINTQQALKTFPLIVWLVLTDIPFIPRMAAIFPRTIIGWTRESRKAARNIARTKSVLSDRAAFLDKTGCISIYRVDRYDYTLPVPKKTKRGVVHYETAFLCCYFSGHIILKSAFHRSDAEGRIYLC
jgi:hypothetical protein